MVVKVDFYTLFQPTFMLGFAWHGNNPYTQSKTLELFFGLFAVVIEFD